VQLRRNEEQLSTEAEQLRRSQASSKNPQSKSTPILQNVKRTQVRFRAEKEKTIRSHEVER
jgi:hypothetical protein